MLLLLFFPPPERPRPEEDLRVPDELLFERDDLDAVILRPRDEDDELLFFLPPVLFERLLFEEVLFLPVDPDLRPRPVLLEDVDDLFAPERDELLFEADFLALPLEDEVDFFLPPVEDEVDFFLPSLEDEDFFLPPDEDDEDDFLEGTLPPSLRASDRPMAMACLRLFTFLPDPPDFNSPCFISCMALSTLSEAFFPYFAII